MANVLTGTIWLIDTASATALTTDPLMVRSFEYLSGTTGAADNQCIVQDRNGKELFRSIATGANFVDRKFHGTRLPIDGLIVPTLDAGRLYVYLE